MKPLQPQPLEWISDAPLQVAASRDIASTADEVFAVLADHESWPTWFTSVSEVEVIGMATGVGGERRVRVKGLGDLEEEFNAWEPGHRFGFTVVAMSRPSLNSLNELVTIEPSTNGVLVTYQQGFDPKRWVAPLLKRAAKEKIPQALVAALAGLERAVIERR